MRRLVPALGGLAVAAALYAWRGGHYPLAVDLLALGSTGLMVAVGVRQLLERNRDDNPNPKGTTR